VDGEIIVGYDGRDASLDAVVLGRLLAAATGSPLSLAIALPYDPLLVGLEEYEQALEVDAQRLIERARPHLEGIAFETRAYGGDSVTKLLHDLAEREHAAAIVLGSTHRGPVGRLLPGSVAERLLAGAPCAVAVAPVGFAQGGNPKLEVIGVGFDGSKEAQGALDAARELAAASGAELRLFVVAEPPMVMSPEAGWMAAAALKGEEPELATKRERALEQAASDALAALPNELEATKEHAAGDPGTILVERSREVDLMVVGSRRYGPVRRVLLGDVSGRVMRASACPVVVVPRGKGGGG
jgi:nucleotide-binding universal stress UspA family protein